MKLVAMTAFFAFVCGAAHSEPKIVYSKYFKGSVPEFVETTIAKSGHVSFKDGPDDDRPLQFTLTAAQIDQFFELAEKLDHFSQPLEFAGKVANMGMKTFRYEDGAAAHEVKFNYTENADARQLADWFECITESEEDLINLERTVKFDKLGVNQALLQLQITVERGRIVAPDQFLPLLDRIIKNESFMHMSRERAANLAEAFRRPPAPDKAPKKATGNHE